MVLDGQAGPLGRVSGGPAGPSGLSHGLGRSGLWWSVFPAWLSSQGVGWSGFLAWLSSQGVGWSGLKSDVGSVAHVGVALLGVAQ